MFSGYSYQVRARQTVLRQMQANIKPSKRWFCAILLDQLVHLFSVSEYALRGNDLYPLIKTSQYSCCKSVSRLFLETFSFSSANVPMTIPTKRFRMKREPIMRNRTKKMMMRGLWLRTGA